VTTLAAGLRPTIDWYRVALNEREPVPGDIVMRRAGA
jgi:hypothetical protein